MVRRNLRARSCDLFYGGRAVSSDCHEPVLCVDLAGWSEGLTGAEGTQPAGLRLENRRERPGTGWIWLRDCPNTR